jgi:hypothetical protein
MTTDQQPTPAQQLIGDFVPKMVSLTDDVLSVTSGPVPNCHPVIAA